VPGEQPWATWWGAQRTFEEGDAVLVLFQPGAGRQLEFHLERGEWATADYRRWAFHAGTRFEMSISEGPNPQSWGELVGRLAPDPDRWYYLLLGIDPGGEFVAFAWEKDAEAPQLEYRRQMDDTWAGPGWVFGMGANRGDALIDSVTEVAFGAVSQPDSAGVHFWEALALVDRDEPADALTELDEALDLDSGNPVYLYYRGMTQWAMGSVDEAQDDLQAASERDPRNDEYLRQLAWLHATERSEPDAALAYAEDALTLAPLDARNHRMRGLIRRDALADPQGALEDLSRAVELAPLEAELLRLRGETHNLLGDYQSGLQDGLQCADLQPEDAACYIQQARSHVGLGDESGAAAAYRRFLDTTDEPVCPGCREEAEAYVERFE
jgi:tetratricopeptide (TPR) repeat protein